MTTSSFLFSTAILFLFAFFSCINDKLPQPETPSFCNDIEASYNTNVKDIVDGSCAYSGCHDGAGGIGVGNYTSYNGMLNVLESGLLRDRVLGQKDNPANGMPPDQSVYPESQKDNLTEEELQIIECWLDSGFPEDF